MSTGGVPACMNGSSADESDISRSVFGSVLRNLFMGWGGGGGWMVRCCKNFVLPLEGVGGSLLQQVPILWRSVRDLVLQKLSILGGV
jgi:hypothetical protein